MLLQLQRAVGSLPLVSPPKLQHLRTLPRSALLHHDYRRLVHQQHAECDAELGLDLARADLLPHLLLCVLLWHHQLADLRHPGRVRALRQAQGGPTDRRVQEGSGGEAVGEDDEGGALCGGYRAGHRRAEGYRLVHPHDEGGGGQGGPTRGLVPLPPATPTAQRDCPRAGQELPLVHQESRRELTVSLFHDADHPRLHHLPRPRQHDPVGVGRGLVGDGLCGPDLLCYLRVRVSCQGGRQGDPLRGAGRLLQGGLELS
mmetsp:Transcript_9637/g.21926  ORF Transcript_9637/g.21926 Transcript_9637/m.21926 type:complete len:258 (+) Transcript_9637:141-914(+)